MVAEVALRKESVDRNREIVMDVQLCTMSLSARRAWIEIYVMGHRLRAYASLSARRAWIEIANIPCKTAVA